MKKCISKAERESGVELLRIFAILGVIMIHFYEAAAGNAMPLINKQVLMVLRTFSSASVDVFLIISGYFMCVSNQRNLSKALDLILQVSFFNELAYLIEVCFGIWPLSIRHIVSSALPDCYYSILFVSLYILSPYVNKLLIAMSKFEYQRFLAFIVGLFSIYAIAVDFMGEVSGQDWHGLSTIGAWGSQSGFTFINFALLYCIGAYLRLHGTPIFLDNRRNKIFVCITLLFLILLWAEINEFFSTFGMQSSWQYHNPFVILYSVVLFNIFSNIHFSNIFVNQTAKVVYPLFLIHCCAIKYFHVNLWANSSVYKMLAGFFLFSMSMFLISWGGYILYNKTIGKIVQRFCSKDIIYFD